MMKFYFMLIMLMLISLNIKFKLMFIYMFIMLLLMMLILLLNFNLNLFFMNIYYWMGIDYLMLLMIMLSIFIVSLMFLISNNILNKSLFSNLLMILLISLMLSFSSMNYFIFYIFFEISLIPTFLLIMIFGYQPERLNASMYMMFYTLFASLPLLMIIYLIYYNFESLDYYMIMKMNTMKNFNSFLFYFFMIFAFLIKLPMFLFHMWLPKAHVEAPISGSMILAGVMLKLGGYGLFRSMNMMLKLCMKFNIYFIILNLIGILFISILCLRQNDLKVLVAYSSVVHMSMMLISLMTMYSLSKISFIFMMIGHGFCSPGLFMLVNFIYERSKTRNIYMNKGMINLIPSMMMFWFFFCIGNMGAPITLNLISELMIMMTLMNWSFKLIIYLILMMLISAIYSLYLFSIVYHDNYYYSKNMFNNKIIEFKSLLLLIIPLNILSIKLDYFI